MKGSAPGRSVMIVVVPTVGLWIASTIIARAGTVEHLMAPSAGDLVAPLTQRWPCS